METKDYVIIGLVLLVIGVPIGVHVYHRGKGKLRKMPRNPDSVIDDNRRLGTAIAAYGGKTIAEGGKLAKYGSLRYHNDSENKNQQHVGGS
jgi:hypothetical protein